MTKHFTFAVPLRGTDMEMGFLEKSLKSAISLNPPELLIGVDEPTPEGLKEKIEDVCASTGFENYRILAVPRDPSWKFQLANVVWNMYKEAKYDKILSFDIDSTLRPEVMLGYDDVGNGTLLTSFTKRLRTKSISEIIRYIAYRIRVMGAEKPFAGIYWIYRPYFFDLVDLDEYKNIINGVDGYLQVKLAKADSNTSYFMKCRKEKGCNCLDIQNEDYPWRQFQAGIWINANDIMPAPNRRPDPVWDWRNWRNASFGGMMIKLQRTLMKKIFGDATLQKNTKLFMLLKCFVYGHYQVIGGYQWAKKHPDHEAVRLAKTMGYNEWGLLGGKYVKNIKQWKRKGTGFE